MLQSPAVSQRRSGAAMKRIDFFGNFDDRICRKTFWLTRVAVIVELYRDLVRILEANGRYLVPEGNGSHEIWYSPICNRNGSVLRSPSRATLPTTCSSKQDLRKRSDHDRRSRRHRP